MDYSHKNRQFCVSSEVLDTVTQQAVDLDFNLPDYCADIEKILKCSLIPKIYTRQLSAGQLRIDGASVVRILYCDNNKNALRCCEQIHPFSATLPVNSDSEENIILITAKSEYINCRALSQRRLSVHGAFSLYATVITKNTCEITEEFDDTSLQVKREEKNVCQLCEFTQDQFEVNESVNLRTTTNVETIVRSQVCALITDVKESGDKITLNGEVTLRMLYICDSSTGETDQFIYVFPFSQKIGYTSQEFDISDVRLDVLSYDLMLKSEMLSEEPVLNIDIKMCASFMGYKNQSFTYISDAYSVSDNTEINLDTVTLCCDIMPIYCDSVIKTSLSLGDKNIRKIVDIFGEEPSISAILGENAAIFKGKINMCILAITDEGELISIERPIDIDVTHVLEKNYGFIKNPSVQITSLSFRMSDNNQLEIRLDIHLSAVVSVCENIGQVTSVTSSGEGTGLNFPYALTLYYAHKGERIWDIAKAYKTPIESICSENSLSEDELSDDRMLLVLRA